jgi:cyanophycinase
MRLKQHVPAGTLVAIGGKEQKCDHALLLMQVLKATGKSLPRICLVTLASGQPGQLEKLYRKAFGRQVHEFSSIHFTNRSHAEDPGNEEKVNSCDFIFFTGGDQLKLCSLLSGTRLLSVMKHRFMTEENFVIAGTSAGAAALADQMIFRGDSRSALLNNRVEVTKGLGFLDHLFFDTHFIARGRFGRLLQAVVTHHHTLGIGLAENTAVFIKSGSRAEVYGTGPVILFDTSGIRYTRERGAVTGNSRGAGNIIIHLLGNGDFFSV